MNKLWLYKSHECKHENSCAQSILYRFIRNFVLAFGIKFTLRLLTERKLPYLMKTLPNVARFGLAIGLCSFLFKVCKCLFKNSGLNLKPDFETFIAAGRTDFLLNFILAISSLGLLLTNERELQILTMLIYPKVLSVFLRLLQEKGLVKNFKFSETIGFMICSIIITYCYVAEPSNLPPSYIKGINSFAMLTQGEATIFATVAEQTTRDINKYYFGKEKNVIL